MVIQSSDDVADFLLSEREMLGLGQVGFSRRVGVDQQLVSLYERGRQMPNLATLCRIADALGFDVVLQPRADVL